MKICVVIGLMASLSTCSGRVHITQCGDNRNTTFTKGENNTLTCVWEEGEAVRGFWAIREEGGYLWLRSIMGCRPCHWDHSTLGSITVWAGTNNKSQLWMTVPRDYPGQWMTVDCENNYHFDSCRVDLVARPDQPTQVTTTQASLRRTPEVTTTPASLRRTPKVTTAPASLRRTPKVTTAPVTSTTLEGGRNSSDRDNSSNDNSDDGREGKLAAMVAGVTGGVAIVIIVALVIVIVKNRCDPLYAKPRLSGRMEEVHTYTELGHFQQTTPPAPATSQNANSTTEQSVHKDRSAGTAQSSSAEPHYENTTAGRLQTSSFGQYENTDGNVQQPPADGDNEIPDTNR